LSVDAGGGRWRVEKKREGEGGKVKGPRIGPADKIGFNFILLRYEGGEKSAL